MFVQITEDEYLDLLLDRVRVWNDDENVVALFEEMYQNYIDNGVFESNTATVMEIVDNDWVNWCDIIYSDDERYDEILKSYNDGEYECEYGYVEAVDLENEMILIRLY